MSTAQGSLDPNPLVWVAVRPPLTGGKDLGEKQKHKDAEDEGKK